MLLSHTKLVLGNSLIDIRSSNYFSIIPTILLVELRIINDPDKYLDEFVEIIRSNGDLNFELFDKENLIIFGEFLWFKFIKEFQKMNTYQKSYCFWRYQEYIEDEITHGLVGSFNLEKNNETDFELGYTFDDYFNLSEIYGSSSKTLREKTIKKFMKRSQKNDIFYPKLDDNSITRLKQLIDFQFDFFKKNVYHSKEETHFKLSTNFKILNHPTLGEFQGIYELSGKGLWRIHKNKFLRIGVDFSLDLNDKIAICKKHSILCFGGIPKVYDINYSDMADNANQDDSGNGNGHNNVFNNQSTHNALSQNQGINNPNSGLDQGQRAPYIKAGTLLFAQLDTEIDTDDGGPVMATIYGGKLNGAKIMGQVQQANGNIRLAFNTVSPIEQNKPTFTVNAVALRTEDAKQGIATSINNHTLSRYTSLVFSSALSGISNAYANRQTGTVTQLNNGATVISQNSVSDRELIGQAVGQVGNNLSGEAMRGFSRPPTYKVARGTGLAVYFLSDLYLN